VTEQMTDCQVASVTDCKQGPSKQGHI
jgi:hypothetical protein